MIGISISLCLGARAAGGGVLKPGTRWLRDIDGGPLYDIDGTRLWEYT